MDERPNSNSDPPTFTYELIRYLYGKGEGTDAGPLFFNNLRNLHK
jgi:hypothetical protein